jgi:S-adenosylmethionine hydrolase
MAKPILTFTTDFGLADHYAGTMKGAVLGICPEARMVDISHEVKPFDIAAGAFLIAQAYAYFPRRTVHLVVVDPGVGSARRPILAEAAGQYFVAPDNGVLGLIFTRERHRVRLLENSRYFRQPVSQTFHGRDIFAPAAAHLAAGVAPARFGRMLDDYIRPEFAQVIRSGEKTWIGRVLHIDRFGNIVTNFHARDFPDLESDRFTLTIGRVRVRALARNYAEGGGEPFAIAGSSGYLEVSVNRGSAARKIGIDVGAKAALGLK